MTKVYSVGELYTQGPYHMKSGHRTRRVYGSSNLHSSRSNHPMSIAPSDNPKPISTENRVDSSHEQLSDEFHAILEKDMPETMVRKFGTICDVC